MDTVAEIPRTYDEAIDTLVQWHTEDGELSDMEIYAISDPQKSTVRLIEVSDGFPETGDVLPVTFGKSNSFPFKSSVAVLTHGEWKKIRNGDLQFPNSWDLNTAKKVWPRVKI